MVFQCRLSDSKSLLVSSLNKAICWPWVVIHKAWGRDPGSWTVLGPTTEVVTWLATLPFGPKFNELSKRPDPINQLVMSSLNTSMIVPTVFFKLLLWQTSAQPYFILKITEDGGWGSIAVRKQYLNLFKQWTNTR